MEILACSYRGDMEDLVYTGHVAVVDYKGALLYYAGDPDKMAFARSSAKPIQAMCALESGAVDAFGLTESELALLCASHNGEVLHTDAVRSVLKKAGLDESCLQCGSHAPLYAPAARALEDAGVLYSEIHCNCSGKHSGMLITAKHLGEDLGSYYTRGHNVQKRITAMIADMCEIEQERIILGTDGCGVPVHAMPMRKFAQGFARMTMPACLPPERAEYARRITAAMRKHPLMMSGTDRIDVDIMNHLPVFAKSGADGYYMVGLMEKGIAVTVKIDSGAEHVRNIVILETLRQLGVLEDSLLPLFDRWYKLEVRNHKNEVVGYTKPVFTLHKA